MDTYMDTYFLIWFPFNFLELFFCNDIVAPKNWSGSVPGDGHDGEVVVAGDTQIVYGTVTQVVGDDRGHVKTIIKMLAANNADYTPARVALAA